MSYAITVYFNDDTIESTDIYTQYFSYTGYSGDDMYATSGLTFSVKFTANPASGCNFTRWVYRLGSVTGTVRYSTANPFTYSGDEDIYIRAEGEEEYVEPEDPTWSLSSKTVGTISDVYNWYSYGSDYTFHRFKISFENSGTATFYTLDSGDTYGYLTKTTGYDDVDGEPTGTILASNDDGGDRNFYFTYDVTAGTTYYLWVRFYDIEDYGYIDLYIEPPEVVTRPNDFSWTYSKVQGGTFNLTATEWNNFTSRINAFREYKGLSDYSFTRAYSGNNFTAAMYNQARIAIQAISGYGTYIPTVTKGQQITAYMMNVLVSELNAIP